MDSSEKETEQPASETTQEEVLQPNNGVETENGDKETAEIVNNPIESQGSGGLTNILKENATFLTDNVNPAVPNIKKEEEENTEDKKEEPAEEEPKEDKKEEKEDVTKENTEEEKPQVEEAAEDKINISQEEDETGPIIISFVSYDPVEVENALDSLMKNDTQPIDQMVEPVQQLINRKKLQALIDSQYEQAEKYDKALTLLIHRKANNAFSLYQTMRQQTLDDHEEILKEKLKQTKEKWNQKLAKQNENAEMRIRQIDERHRSEILQFKKNWQDPDFLRQFNRPSHRLLALREIEKRMALSKNYEEAREKKKEADEVQAFEESKMQEYIELKMQGDFLKLKEEQDREIQKFKEFQRKSEIELMIMKQREIEPIESAIKQMAARKKIGINKKLHMIPQSLQSIHSSLDAPSARTKLITPSTQKRYSNYRDQKKASLRITPISDEKFQKLEAMSMRARQRKANTPKRSTLPKL